jgi:competence protein ComEC
LFVGFISPAYAVISGGKNNKYGHPNKEILDLFANLSVQTLRTDELGTISFSSDGTKFTRD